MLKNIEKSLLFYYSFLSVFIVLSVFFTVRVKMAEFDLQRLCRNVIHSNGVSIESLPKILQKDFQYECCCSNNLLSSYRNDHLECAKAYNLSKRAIQKSSILRLSLIDGKIDWLEWSRENGALWTFRVKLKLYDCEDVLCLEYAAANGAYDTHEDYSDFEEDSTDDEESDDEESDDEESDDEESEDEESDSSSSPSYYRGSYRREEYSDDYSTDSDADSSLSWFTESEDDESDAVLDTDEEWSDDDKDDVNKLINVIRSKLPETNEKEREDELKIVKVCVEYFDTKESLVKYLKKIM